MDSVLERGMVMVWRCGVWCANLDNELLWTLEKAWTFFRRHWLCTKGSLLNSPMKFLRLRCMRLNDCFNLKTWRKSPWGIAPFSDSLLHWEQANKHLACTCREVWIWLSFDAMGIKFIKRRSRNGFWKNTNFYGIDLTAAVARCSKPGISICWPCQADMKVLWKLSCGYCVWVVQRVYFRLSRILETYPSDIHHKSDDSSSALSWCHASTQLATWLSTRLCTGPRFPVRVGIPNSIQSSKVPKEEGFEHFICWAFNSLAVPGTTVICDNVRPHAWTFCESLCNSTALCLTFQIEV